jgi:hypothetical protein
MLTAKRNASVFNQIKAYAETNSLGFWAFDTATACRWISSYKCFVSVLRNQQVCHTAALALGLKVSVWLDTEEKVDLFQICAVLNCFKAALRMVEGAGINGVASMALPVFHILQTKLSATTPRSAPPASSSQVWVHPPSLKRGI